MCRAPDIFNVLFDTVTPVAPVASASCSENRRQSKDLSIVTRPSKVKTKSATSNSSAMYICFVHQVVESIMCTFQGRLTGFRATFNDGKGKSWDATVAVDTQCRSCAGQSPLEDALVSNDCIPAHDSATACRYAGRGLHTVELITLFRLTVRAQALPRTVFSTIASQSVCDIKYGPNLNRMEILPARTWHTIYEMCPNRAC